MKVSELIRKDAKQTVQEAKEAGDEKESEEVEPPELGGAMTGHRMIFERSH